MDWSPIQHSMSKIQLSLACNLTDRTRAVHNGTVQPEGIDLNYIPLDVEEIFWRMLRYQEFDASEMSMSSYMMARDRGDPAFIAIPVFPSRYFRHSCVFINTDAGIEKPEDLKGKRIGVPEYQMTSPLWIRGIMQHDYGVHPSDVTWFHGGEEDEGREEKLALDLPDDIDLSPIPETATLSGQLEQGEIDALFTARSPSSFATDSVARLFPNFRDVEKDYYERTGFFPIMHTIVIREPVYERHPWIAQELTKVFTDAKDRCLQRLTKTNALQTTLPWLHHELEETQALMGADYWQYGIDNNREMLETMVQYSYEQGLIKTEFELSDLFAPETFEEFKV